MFKISCFVHNVLALPETHNHAQYLRVVLQCWSVWSYCDKMWHWGYLIDRDSFTSLWTYMIYSTNSSSQCYLMWRLCPAKPQGCRNVERCRIPDATLIRFTPRPKKSEKERITRTMISIRIFSICFGLAQNSYLELTPNKAQRIRSLTARLHPYFTQDRSSY